MNTRFLTIGTISAALALFVWQSISNVALPWHMPAEFTSDSAVVAAIKANAPTNGVYAANQGIWAFVSFTPDMADKTLSLGPMLAQQFVADVALAFALCFLFLALPRGSTTAIVRAFAIAGFAAGLLTPIPNSIWYGYPIADGIADTIDIVINFALAGFVLAIVHRRFSAAPATPGVRPEGGLRPTEASRSTSKA